MANGASGLISQSASSPTEANSSGARESALALHQRVVAGCAMVSYGDSLIMMIVT